MKNAYKTILFCSSPALREVHRRTHHCSCTSDDATDDDGWKKLLSETIESIYYIETFIQLRQVSAVFKVHQCISASVQLQVQWWWPPCRRCKLFGTSSVLFFPRRVYYYIIIIITITICPDGCKYFVYEIMCSTQPRSISLAELTRVFLHISGVNIIQ